MQKVTSKVQQQTNLKNPSPLRNVEDTISSQVDSSRASDAKRQYGLYMRAIMETLSRRSLAGVHNKVAFEFLSYLDLRSIVIFKLVSKELFYLSFVIDKIDAPVRPKQSNLAVGRKCKNFTPLITVTKEMIMQRPLGYYNGPITLVSSPSDIMQAVNVLTKETLLGFDVESRPAFKKGESYPPSLIQLAGEKIVFIFQLHLTNIEPFKALFENNNIKKVGVGINGDVRQLRKLGSFKPSSFVEISNHTGCKNIHNKGLQALAAFLLDVQISKTKKVQLSNWANLNLTPTQITYAATDAWISREIYKKLEQSSSADQS